ncbi:RHS repeat domain-containing protein [Ereboglobus luteus]
MPSAAARARGALSTHKTYDAAGRLTRVEQRDASDTVVWAENHLYDDRGRLRKKETTAGIIEYTRDSRGNIERVSTNHGTGTDYYYDTDNRLAAADDQDGSTTIYGYNAVGSLATVTLPNGVTTSYTYNALNRLANITTTGSGGAVAAFDYTLRPSGHRSQLIETIGGVTRTTDWAYDNLNRLTAETVNGTDTVNYTYDKVGNRQNRATSGIANLPSVGLYSYDLNDRLLSADAHNYTYDNNGNTLTGHANTAGINHLTGLPLAAQTVTDIYDHNNRLIKRVGGGNTITIIYDADGNRVGKTVNGTTTYYLVDTQSLTGYAQVIEEVRGGIVQKRYTYGLDRISQQHRQGDGTYQTRYYGYDGLGSVRYLTDDAGSITDRYTYDGYGTLINKWSSGTAADNVYLYAGEQYDSDLGLYYNRARYLNTDAGRFWTKDNFEGACTEPRSLHKYLYAHGCPTSGIDPSGNFFIFDVLGNITQWFRNNAQNSINVGRVVTQVKRFFWDTRTFQAISKAYWKTNGPAMGKSLHHWLIPQRWTFVPQGLRNAGFNLLELPKLLSGSLGLNQWMGFAVKWGGYRMVVAYTIETGIKILLPLSMGTAVGTGAYVGYQIGNDYIEVEDIDLTPEDWSNDQGFEELKYLGLEEGDIISVVPGPFNMYP